MRELARLLRYSHTYAGHLFLSVALMACVGAAQGLTALLIVRGYEALRGGEARGAGALAPAEAFDARRLLARLAPLLVLADGA